MKMIDGLQTEWSYEGAYMLMNTDTISSASLYVLVSPFILLIFPVPCTLSLAYCLGHEWSACGLMTVSGMSAP